MPEVSYEFNYSLDNDGKPVLEPVGADIVVTTSDAEKTTVKLEGGNNQASASIYLVLKLFYY